MSFASLCSLQVVATCCLLLSLTQMRVSVDCAMWSATSRHRSDPAGRLSCPHAAQKCRRLPPPQAQYSNMGGALGAGVYFAGREPG